MAITDYQAKLIAYDLTRRCPSDSEAKLAATVAGAQVDLNPHQVDAALFAFGSPLSKGVILADEVGLGKTIEAGLVISQKWAERKWRILVITPANLRKQWHQELGEKFFLNCHILESKSYNAAIRRGEMQPFEPKEAAVIICSYQFAASKAADVHRTQWNLVVIDEAHRLRNVYKPNNKIANTLKRALNERHKLLLTATPLQNSLLELFGLVSVIDDHTFGDMRVFREQFTNADEAALRKLKARLKPLCHRTLRRQVTAYVPYTQRHAIVQPFNPSDSEDQLYDLVCDYLQRDNLQALPHGQRKLMTLVLLKLLASSSFAIAGALNSMINRLTTRLKDDDERTNKRLLPLLSDELSEDYEGLQDTAEEWNEETQGDALTIEDRNAIKAEITDLVEFTRLAQSIEHNAKGLALITALKTAFAKARDIGASEKAIIFTESRKTQSYLLRLLADSPYAEGVVLFNGTNTDEHSRMIYAKWASKYQGTDRITGSRTADLRSALVDYFREDGRIMIATEAGSEGINLQFCSLVINYDMPWNPQRIEQRIGRCHRYGQKHDVVVVNFLNKKNQADLRVYQLLDQKFELFRGVFGSSDEVLGAIESGVDFEMRIAAIYRNCRKPEEIKEAFDQLQLELNLEINESLRVTREKLLENFDEEVQAKLKLRDDSSRHLLSHFEKQLMTLTRHELRDHATFQNDSIFELYQAPDSLTQEVPTGVYGLPRGSTTAHTYRLGHPLADHVVAEAKTRQLPPAEIEFNYGQHGSKISILEPLRGHTGILAVWMFTIETMVQAEDHFIYAACTDAGGTLDQEQVSRLLTLPAVVKKPMLDFSDPPVLKEIAGDNRERIQQLAANRNANYIEVEAQKLDDWADDRKAALEREIKDLDSQIKEARKTAVRGLTLEEKLQGQKLVRALERERAQSRRNIFKAQDEVDAERDKLISQVEDQLTQKNSMVEIMRIRWSLA